MTMAYTIVLRCQACGSSFLTTKYSKPAKGQVTTANGNQECPGCGGKTGVVVAVQEG